MLSLIVSIIALGAIVAFHELGHFSAARLFKVGVIEFSVGMGPRAASFVRGNTRYSLRLIPFGGSCMMLSEDMDESLYAGEGETAGAQRGTGDPLEGCGEKKLSGKVSNGAFGEESFKTFEDGFVIDGRRYYKDEQFIYKPAWQRFLVIAAGPFFNFLLGFFLALIITACLGYDRPVVMEVAEGSELYGTGIERGDVITGLAVISGGKVPHMRNIKTSRDVQLFMMEKSASMDNQDTFVIRFTDAGSPSGETTTVAARPFYDEEYGRYRLGFSYNSSYGKTESLLQTVYFSFYEVGYCIRSVAVSIKMLVTGRLGGAEVMGPVRMVAVMDESVDTAAGYGLTAAFLTLANLMLLISCSLGAMNLLPLPALDGGRLVFIAIELITGHAVPRELEGAVHAAGMLFLLGLMVLILFNDVSMLLMG